MFGPLKEALLGQRSNEVKFVVHTWLNKKKPSQIDQKAC
jgi:hypothetical protein